MSIDYAKQDHIVTITFNRYERRNSMDVEHAQGLSAAWRRFDEDPDARVAIITGVRDSFSSGGDLRAMGDIAREKAELGYSPTEQAITGDKEYAPTLKGSILCKPVVAAVNGYCMAGGMELLGGTDIRIASANAEFSVTEVRRGLFAGGGTPARLPRQLSWPAAMELLLVADNISADRAFQLGLVNQVVEPPRLMEAAYEWARKIAANAPISVQQTKRAALASLAVGSLQEAYAIEDACANIVFATEDAQEGPRAFLEKRAPIWKAR